MFDKEPDTIEWIKKFKVENNRSTYFLGYWSKYWTYIHYIIMLLLSIPIRSKIFAFEPSTSNLRVLSRNIFINNFHK
jgi:hypothetical protein